MEEIYKHIDDFDNYLISNYGNVKNKLTNKVLSKSNCKGVYKVNLCKDGKKYNIYIHRLIALHFINNPNNNEFVIHIDNNRLNNDINNLKWISKEDWVKRQSQIDLQRKKQK